MSFVRTFYIVKSTKMSSEEIEGFQVVVQALKHHGIEYMFGVVGIPIVEVAIAAQQVKPMYCTIVRNTFRSNPFYSISMCIVSFNKV